MKRWMWVIAMGTSLVAGCEAEGPVEETPPLEACEVPGEYRCSDDVLESCSSALEWIVEQVCDGEELCSVEQQSCASNDCAVGDVVCQGLEVHKCLPGGGLIFMEKCEGVETCSVPDGGCACVPDCEGRTCGTDGCGGDCGECTPDLLCHNDGQCKDECVPEGTGIFVGKHMGDITWNEASGGTVNLHDFCKTTATVIIEVADW